MRRREWLATLGGTVSASVAGCAGVSRLGSVPTETRTGPPGPVGRVNTAELPIPRDRLTRGAARDEIAAITQPAFGDDWSGVSVEVRVDLGQRPESDRTTVIEPRLAPDDRVIGIARGGEARAYPLRLLVWHEVVNDTFDGSAGGTPSGRSTAAAGRPGAPTLVTYCPLCATAVTARRTVGGHSAMFGVSGLLWRANLVMYDERTGSLWSQVAATAIRGPHTGDRLSLVPSRLTTLAAWRDRHPDTRVLLPPPASETVRGPVTYDYRTDPYAGYEARAETGLDGTAADDRLHPKVRVLGVAHDGAARAYPLPAVREHGVVNDAVGGLPVAVAVGPEEATLVGYVRRVNGRTVRFRRGDDFLAAAGSRWDVVSGRAVDGPHEGTRLTPAGRGPLFWFTWVDFHPDTTLFGRS
ncbi:MAG: DUF3179 domain-containing protein [Halobaculum sp.]